MHATFRISKEKVDTASRSFKCGAGIRTINPGLALAQQSSTAGFYMGEHKLP